MACEGGGAWEKRSELGISYNGTEAGREAEQSRRGRDPEARLACSAGCLGRLEVRRSARVGRLVKGREEAPKQRDWEGTTGGENEAGGDKGRGVVLADGGERGSAHGCGSSERDAQIAASQLGIDRGQGRVTGKVREGARAGGML